MADQGLTDDTPVHSEVSGATLAISKEDDDKLLQSPKPVEDETISSGPTQDNSSTPVFSKEEAIKLFKDDAQSQIRTRLSEWAPQQSPAFENMEPRDIDPDMVQAAMQEVSRHLSSMADERQNALTELAPQFSQMSNDQRQSSVVKYHVNIKPTDHPTQIQHWVDLLALNNAKGEGRAMYGFYIEGKSELPFLNMAESRFTWNVGDSCDSTSNMTPPG